MEVPIRCNQTCTIKMIPAWTPQAENWSPCPRRKHRHTNLFLLDIRNHKKHIGDLAPCSPETISSRFELSASTRSDCSLQPGWDAPVCWVNASDSARTKGSTTAESGSMPETTPVDRDGFSSSSSLRVAAMIFLQFIALFTVPSPDSANTCCAMFLITTKQSETPVLLISTTSEVCKGALRIPRISFAFSRISLEQSHPVDSKASLPWGPTSTDANSTIFRNKSLTLELSIGQNFRAAWLPRRIDGLADSDSSSKPSEIINQHLIKIWNRCDSRGICEVLPKAISKPLSAQNWYFVARVWTQESVST